MIKESSESLLKQATLASLLLRPSLKSLMGMCPLHCILPSPFIVVVVVVVVVERLNVVTEHLNVVAKRQSCACITIVIFVCVCNIHSSSLIFSNLVARIN